MLMSLSVPVLTPDQIEELRSLVHGILEQNARSIDDVMSELVDVETTNILALYNLLADQWQQKQRTVDNLAHFALTMMATVQLLWDQKFHNDELLANAHAALDQLRAENEHLRAHHTSQNPQQGIIHIEPEIEIAQTTEKTEPLSKSQSCIHFGEQPQTSQIHSPEPDHECRSDSPQVEAEVRGLVEERQGLVEEKQRLERELSEAIEEGQLTRMELELAELAIKDALAYKASYLSLLHTSRVSDHSSSLQNADYLNGEIECHSHIDDSFTTHARKFFADEHHPPASTARPNPNPFKKKENTCVQSGHKEQSNKQGEEESCSSCEGEFQAYRPESQLDERRVREMISRFKIKQSKLSDRQDTAEESLQSQNSLFNPRKTLTTLPCQPTESSITKFYNFITKKVVRSRIKRR